MVKFFVKAGLVVLGSIVLILIAAGSFLLYDNYSTAKAITVEAKSEFKSDSIQSLIDYINSQSHTLKEKNLAVWTLGQFSDEKAAPFLTRLRAELTDSNGEEFDHQKYICRYEVDKALEWCTQKHYKLPGFIYSNREKW